MGEQRPLCLRGRVRSFKIYYICGFCIIVLMLFSNSKVRHRRLVSVRGQANTSVSFSWKERLVGDQMQVQANVSKGTMLSRAQSGWSGWHLDSPAPRLRPPTQCCDAPRPFPVSRVGPYDEDSHSVSLSGCVCVARECQYCFRKPYTLNPKRTHTHTHIYIHIIYI